MTVFLTLQVNSPFVVSLYYAFQTADKLCFILDLMNGSASIQAVKDSEGACKLICPNPQILELLRE